MHLIKRHPPVKCYLSSQEIARVLAGLPRDDRDYVPFFALVASVARLLETHHEFNRVAFGHDCGLCNCNARNGLGGWCS